jgi:hypothetical protein
MNNNNNNNNNKDQKKKATSTKYKGSDFGRLRGNLPYSKKLVENLTPIFIIKYRFGKF